MIPILYLAAGAAIAFFGVLGFMDPDKFWPFRGPLIVKRILSALAVVIGAILMAQGFAHF